MAQGYNSELISRLYTTNNTGKVTDLLEEMCEIQDPIFVYPIKDAFYRFKGSHISHYFISALEDFKNKDALNIAVDIFNDTSTNESNKAWCLPVFQKHNYLAQEVVEWAIGRIEKFVLGKEDFEIELSFILNYLEKANKLSLTISILKKVVMNDSLRRHVRNVALGFFLKADPNRTFKFLAQEYPKFANKDRDLEIIVSNNVVNWHGETVDSLKEIIKEKGSPRAKEIIKKAEKNEAEKEKKSKKKEVELFQNTGLIFAISEFRQNINFISRERLNINYDVFNQNELLITQNEVVKDKASLKSKCSDLRFIISDVASETKNHGLDAESMKDLLPDTTEVDYNKSLNSFFFFLKSKDIDVDKDLFELRKLYNLCGLISSHPEEKEDLIKLLRELRMATLYSTGKWGNLHVALLKKYQGCLKELHGVILKYK